jgi:hypothetical protein
MGGSTIRTLIATGMTDIHHDWRATTPAIKRLLENTGRFDVRHLAGGRPLHAARQPTDVRGVGGGRGTGPAEVSR